MSPHGKASPKKNGDKPLPIAVRRGPKPKKTKIVAAYLPEVQYFQAVFSRYFSHLADDLDSAGFEMSWLYTRVLGNPLDTVRRTKAKKELAKITAALRLMGKHDLDYWQWLSGMIFEAKKDGDELADDVDKIFKFLLDLRYMEQGMLNKVVKRFAANAIAAIDRVPERGNIKWDATHAIDGLRILWWRNTGIDAPSRALNPASRFASYLRDGFHFLEIKANPESAFRRWVAAYPKE